MDTNANFGAMIGGSLRSAFKNFSRFLLIAFVQVVIQFGIMTPFFVNFFKIYGMRGSLEYSFFPSGLIVSYAVAVLVSFLMAPAFFIYNMDFAKNIDDGTDWTFRKGIEPLKKYYFRLLVVYLPVFFGYLIFMGAAMTPYLIVAFRIMQGLFRAWYLLIYMGVFFFFFLIMILYMYLIQMLTAGIIIDGRTFVSVYRNVAGILKRGKWTAAGRWTAYFLMIMAMLYFFVFLGYLPMVILVALYGTGIITAASGVMIPAIIGIILYFTVLVSLAIGGYNGSLSVFSVKFYKQYKGEAGQ